MKNNRANIYLIEHDEQMREAIVSLLKSVDLDVEAFTTSDAFLEAYQADKAACLLMDVRMPEVSGLELHREFQEKGLRIPTIFISAFADVSVAVQAMKQGAVDFILKPFNDQVLLDAVYRAVKIAKQQEVKMEKRSLIQQCLERLTPREREVMGLVIKAKSSKNIATELGISHKTVELHRSKIIEKMKVSSAIELVNLMHSFDTACAA